MARIFKAAGNSKGRLMPALGSKGRTGNLPRFGGGDLVPSITHVVLYGQSLSLGSATDGTDLIISSLNASHKMFNGGVRVHYDDPGVTNVNTAIDSDQLVSFVDLQEQTNHQFTYMKETFASGIAAQSSRQLLLSCTGRGAYRAEKLDKDGNNTLADSNHFRNTYASVLRGSVEAQEQSIAYSLGPVIFKQGEADASDSRTGAQWISDVQELYANLKTHLKHASHKDTSALPMIIDQLALQQSGKTYAELAVAAIDMHRLDTGIVCAGPTYPEEFAAQGEVHMSSNGYRNYGEKLGRVVDAINRGNTWNPCHITNATRTGTTITLDVHVPVAPLTTDTTLVSTVANSGFTYTGANISSVVISDNGTSDNAGVITITIDADAGGSLGYAYGNADIDIRSGPVNGPRGNIRDSESAVTFNDSSNLHNWLCTDYWTLA